MFLTFIINSTLSEHIMNTLQHMNVFRQNRQGSMAHVVIMEPAYALV